MCYQYVPGVIATAAVALDQFWRGIVKGGKHNIVLIDDLPPEKREPNNKGGTIDIHHPVAILLVPSL